MIFSRVAADIVLPARAMSWSAALLAKVSMIGSFALLAACTSQVVTIKDSGPKQAMDVAHIPDAVPRREARTRAGNKSPYTVLGKTYQVLPDSRGFTEEGIASWYGNKFHGRKTSNGEIYSMYGMTAAHKNLPIPSYVRVTNLDNGRQVVVRVNDRGPFHQGRVIDLTYAAASKLGFVKRGTAPVRVEAVGPGDQAGSANSSERASSVTAVAQPQAASVQSTQSGMKLAPAPANSAGYELPANTFLQAGAFSSHNAAVNLQQRITALTDIPVALIQPQVDSLYRVRVGPIDSNLVLMDLRGLLQRHKMPTPHIVYD